MLLILVPFLICRLYQFYKTKSLCFRSSAQDIAITSLFVLSPLPRFFWIPISFGLFLRWYGFFRYQADILLFLKSPGCFSDSFKTASIKKPLFVGFLLTIQSYFFAPPPSFFWIVLLSLSLFFSFSRRKKSTLPVLSFPNEISTFISPLYPGLRKTHAFLGEKQINLTLEKPNIIFIFLESFRAKNVGCLGAKISASPHFDQWAEKGILFRNFHANGLQTFRAFISAYFGIPAHLRTASLKPFCSMSMVGLPQILKRNGYHPAIIQSGDISFDHLYPFFKKQGFETILGGEDVQGTRTSSWGVDDEAMVRFAATWLGKQVQPTFLSLFTITNHHPWKPPAAWGQFTKDPYKNFLQTFAYTDHCLNIFLENIKLNNSIVFIAGDHGQEMGERRPFSEINHSLYEENIHLPLLILGKKVMPQVIDANASFVDFLPTLLDMLNLKEVHHSLGKSLLRRGDFPTFFSMHQGELQVGAILGKKKVILPKGFDLRYDTDEKIDIGPTLKDLNLQCKTYFQEVDAITQANAWAPQNALFSLKATPNMDEKTWVKYLNKYSDIQMIDLSAGHIGDSVITKISPRLIASWHHVNLRDCTRITDQTLEWLSKHSEKLMALDLSNCHLLTDSGVRLILSQTLRHLWLDGLDLEDFVPEIDFFNLHTCSMKNIPRLHAKSLLSIYKNSPHLIDWRATLTNVKNQDLFEMSRYQKRSTNMSLECGIHIQDEALSQLLASQEELLEIHLENFPLIENPDFSKLTKLRYLTFTACPKLNKTFIDSLKKLPLIRVSFFE